METPRDNNHVPVLMGLSCIDGVTPIPIATNPLTGAWVVDNVSSIAFSPTAIAPRDENHVPVLMGVSSVDGVTPVPIYVNVDGEVLIAE